MTTIDDILNQHLQEFRAGHTEIIKRQLLEAVLSALPDDKNDPTLPVSPAIAWNQCKQRTRRNLRKLFGEAP